MTELPDLLSMWDVPVFAQREEVQYSPELRELGGALRPLGPEDDVRVGPETFQALHTPGSHYLLAGDALVSGDTVFINGCGRCDMSGGNPEDMYRSLSQVLAKVPDSAKLFPGHDYAGVPMASMETVRRKNPCFAFDNVDAFVAFRMRPRKDWPVPRRRCLAANGASHRRHVYPECVPVY
ncbi:conserved hypothetical protein [Myxococcus xanthus DK 1622]|uniref:Metallo-beta-lactamase domain-containing protein n=1 Tax=Myxococcus xanthus (strain DK1622) TaxID=246197 RepID=Q1D9G3_MYXXD|nr:MULTISPECIES: hypothetical protein [Myxococcus]ABF89419.1 conserved hypothetical protein [Myxococcus xanthus DK 1622]NOJ54086.1 hypothetical protein [Myxococcus xanthus]QPM82004.1 hypothetical protein I5Q59_12335 [Myxococcus xanthus]QVW71253.1 hypothetical protein JTM82_17690 [Myxococcus xanthus DZ2]QZZ50215.1 putative polyketide biosynthesis zinc-dependent hydrolase PksB [Myxococcus xanthus]